MLGMHWNIFSYAAKKQCDESTLYHCFNDQLMILPSTWYLAESVFFVLHLFVAKLRITFVRPKKAAGTQFSFHFHFCCVRMHNT